MLTQRVLAKKGLSKAARELASEKVHEVSAQVLAKPKHLHPSSAAVAVEPLISECVWPELTNSEEDNVFLLKAVNELSQIPFKPSYNWNKFRTMPGP